ncbi:MAG: glycosyltransferase [Rickettsiales bacterium]|jgi:CDP-glycerol glycerophosphotransferase|nr:glycosyltransferase [Rickettsiales bacterium]
MKKGTKVSVIIPVYNVERYLAQCLAGVVGQTYKNLEVIIVDDGSTDGSAQICRAWAKRDRRIRVIRQENAGLSSARNAGLDAATGEYVHFIDSDDCISLDYYERMVGSIGGADMAASGFYNEKKPSDSVEYHSSATLVSTLDKLAGTDVASQAMVWRFLFRRAFLVRRGMRFREGRLVEDIMFSIPAVFFASKVEVVPGAQYFYRKNAGSIVNTRDRARLAKRKADYRLAKAELWKFARLHGFAGELRAAKEQVIDRRVYRLFCLFPFMTKIVRRHSVEYRLFGFIPLLKVK